MTQRIFSTVGLWVALLVVLYVAGSTAGVWILALLSALSQYELYRLLDKAGHAPMQRLGLFLGVLIILGSYYLPLYTASGNLLANADLLTFSAIVCAVATLRLNKLSNKTSSLISTLFGIIYIPYMLKYLVLLIHQFTSPETGLFLALWIVVIAKFSDVGGFLVGRKLGKTFLAPEISPHKTWEGALGAIIFAVLTAFVFVLIFSKYFPLSFYPWKAAILAIPVALVAILSDLVESILKRHAGEKNSGTMVPGIGGALDLLDSIILSAPVGYFILYYFLV